MVTLDKINTETIVITPSQLLAHWQGHRSVTRKVIEAFPEKELFEYSIGGMRPFAKMAIEMLRMAVPVIQGTISGNWPNDFLSEEPKTKAQILQLWDKSTEQINSLWQKIPSHRFQESDIAFGQWEGQNYTTILYAIDNEIHHRAQGYVYLRSLGIEPPFFWERG